MAGDTILVPPRIILVFPWIVNLTPVAGFATSEISGTWRIKEPAGVGNGGPLKNLLRPPPVAVEPFHDHVVSTVEESYTKLGQTSVVPPHATTFGEEHGKSDVGVDIPLFAPVSPAAQVIVIPCADAEANRVLYRVKSDAVKRDSGAPHEQDIIDGFTPPTGVFIAWLNTL
jgi:hypothetical protein